MRTAEVAARALIATKAGMSVEKRGVASVLLLLLLLCILKIGFSKSCLQFFF